MPLPPVRCTCVYCIRGTHMGWSCLAVFKPLSSRLEKPKIEKRMYLISLNLQIISLMLEIRGSDPPTP
jgi:hypothetical protein